MKQLKIEGFDISDQKIGGGDIGETSAHTRQSHPAFAYPGDLKWPKELPISLWKRCKLLA